LLDLRPTRQQMECVRQLRKRLGRSVQVFADQAATPGLEGRNRSPIAKPIMARLFSTASVKRRIARREQMFSALNKLMSEILGQSGFALPAL
jgi:hypothetical protein